MSPEWHIAPFRRDVKVRTILEVMRGARSAPMPAASSRAPSPRTCRSCSPASSSWSSTRRPPRCLTSRCRRSCSLLPPSSYTPPLLSSGCANSVGSRTAPSRSSIAGPRGATSALRDRRRVRLLGIDRRWPLAVREATCPCGRSNFGTINAPSFPPQPSTSSGRPNHGQWRLSMDHSELDRSRSATRRAISAGASSGIGNTELTLISPST
jgi:hypothetical protein